MGQLLVFRKNCAKIDTILQAGCRSGVKIMILGVLPRGDSNVDCNDAIAETNEMLTNLEVINILTEENVPEHVVINF